MRVKYLLIEKEKGNVTEIYGILSGRVILDIQEHIFRRIDFIILNWERDVVTNFKIDLYKSNQIHYKRIFGKT